MKIAPLRTTDPWFARILNDETVSVETLRGVPIESTVEVELVELLHGGPEENYRPYLHLRGELTTATPAVELPYGVDGLVLRQGGGLAIDAFYDFNGKQLGELVKKGYFSDAFRVPEEMSGIAWAIPGKADFMVVAPEFDDQPPLVFMDVHNQSALELDERNSGYDLSSYFQNVAAKTTESPSAAPIEGPALGGSGFDVFEHVDFEAHRPVASAPTVVEADPRSAVPAGVFERLIAEIEATLITEPEIDETPDVSSQVTPGSAEDVYNTIVSPGVERALAGDHHAEDLEEVVDSTPPAAPVAEDGFLDLGDPEPELAPLVVAIGDDLPPATSTSTSARAARIRAELLEDDERAEQTNSELDR